MGRPPLALDVIGRAAEGRATQSAVGRSREGSPPEGNWPMYASPRMRSGTLTVVPTRSVPFCPVPMWTPLSVTVV
jgi:hypothetical protein